jgi:hypothetical protein
MLRNVKIIRLTGSCEHGNEPSGSMAEQQMPIIKEVNYFEHEEWDVSVYRNHKVNRKCYTSLRLCWAR